MRYFGLICFFVFCTTVYAQDTETPPLIAWQDGMVVTLSAIDTQPQPLHDTDLLRIPDSSMVSPDGQYVVYPIGDLVAEGNPDEFPTAFDPSGYMLVELATGEESVIVESDVDLYSRNTIWSPDSTQIAWVHDSEGTLTLEVYDLNTQDISIISEDYYGGYRDGGAGVIVPDAPRQWIDDYLVLESGGFSSVTGFVEDIILMYPTQSGEVQIFPFDQHYLFGMPVAVIPATDSVGEDILTYLSYFVWYDTIIEQGDPAVYNLLPTPHLQAINAPDDALTFIPYIDMGGWIHWFARRPHGDLFDTGMFTRAQMNVFPTPDGYGLLHKPVLDFGEVSYYTFWHDKMDSDTLPQFENFVPFWQTGEWSIPTCDRPTYTVRKQVQIRSELSLYALPDSSSEVILDIQPDDDIRVTGGIVCNDSVIWRKTNVVIDGANFGWIPETIDGEPTLEVSEEE